jgi:Mlc titration factor MtfA (ptsG expression regulator)
MSSSLRSLLARFIGRLRGEHAGADAIDDTLWHQTLASLPWLVHLDDAALHRLRELSARFLAAKTVSGAAGFEVDERVRLAIAVQACLPVLRFGLAPYEDFVEIVVYPDRFLVPRTQTDEAGVVHESTDELIGEAMERGPVVLSWSDADPTTGERGSNVVIHEFAHKIDMFDGEADGVPPMPSRERAGWTQEIEGAFESFCGMLDRVEAAIPRHVDPESPEGQAWYGRLPLDPYAATDVSEFFAVAAESFFVDPEPLADVFPGFYRRLADYFGQDPLVASRPPAAPRR